MCQSVQNRAYTNTMHLRSMVQGFLWHGTVFALQAAVGAQSFGRLLVQLQQLVYFYDGLRDAPPIGLLNRLTAIAKVTEKLQHKDRAKTEAMWLDSLFLQNARLAHRFANSPNSYTELGRASDGTLSAEAHMSDLMAQFGKLWWVDDAEANNGMVEAFLELRETLLEERTRGISPDLQRLLDFFAVKKVRAILARFKSNTSVGLCAVESQSLKKSPDVVLASLGELLAWIAWLAIGPAFNFQLLLHVIPKKLAGYRTIATVPSIWRILMGGAAEELRTWDSAAALTEDTAVSGACSRTRVFQSMQNVVSCQAFGKDKWTQTMGFAKFLRDSDSEGDVQGCQAMGHA